MCLQRLVGTCKPAPCWAACCAKAPSQAVLSWALQAHRLWQLAAQHCPSACGPASAQTCPTNAGRERQHADPSLTARQTSACQKEGRVSEVDNKCHAKASDAAGQERQAWKGMHAAWRRHAPARVAAQPSKASSQQPTSRRGKRWLWLHMPATRVPLSSSAVDCEW